MQIGGFLIVPIIFNLFFTTRYTGVVSLAQTVFFLSIQNAYVFPILKILDPIYAINRIRKYLASRPLNRLNLNQTDLNSRFEPLNFSIGF
jgi:hypothetical protein